MQPLDPEIDEAPRKHHGDSKAVTVRSEFPRGVHLTIGQAGCGDVAGYALDRARMSAQTPA